ncbi:MAG: zinc ribbon domain-containing protein [Armatimonadetes bacterium]|nr:zinc ribbon domain-containing protein [Armatimonadota bacterium]
MTDQPRSRRLAVVAYRYIAAELMPAETMVSLPVPLRRDSQLLAAFFGTLTALLPDRTNSVVRPPAVRIYVDWDGERAVGYEPVLAGPPVARDPVAGLLRPPAFTGEMTDELRGRLEAAHAEVYRLLDEVGSLYLEGTLAADGRRVLARLDRAYRRVVPPEIWPLYEALNPDFFQWLAGKGSPEGSPVSCPSCGAELAAPGRFCTRCGHRLGESRGHAE